MTAQNLDAQFDDEYASFARRSGELFTRASQIIPGGAGSSARTAYFGWKPYPPFIAEGQGSRIRDVDGHEYIDYLLGLGPMILGHRHPVVTEAVVDAIRGQGTCFGLPYELEIEAAQKVVDAVPSVEMVRFTNSGSEAVGSAIRIARAVTGRRLVIRFEGHYHGWADEGLVGFANPADQWGDDEHPARFHPSQGVIPAVLEQFVVARWNDPEHLRRRVDQFKGQLAAIVCEPALCNTCCLEPVPGLLGTIRELCDRDGMLMISDETITGFRFGAACAQGYYGYRPDLTVLGKAIGGGMPFAALAGTRAAMAKIISGAVVHAGTLNGNPLCLAASKWCLDEVLALGPAHPAGIQKLGTRLMAGLTALARQHGVPLQPQGPGLIFHAVMLKPGAAGGMVRDYRDYVRRGASYLEYEGRESGARRLRCMLRAIDSVM